MQSRSESFAINTKHLFLYANYEKKKKKKIHPSYFVNEQNKLSLVLYSIPGSHRNKTPLRYFTTKFGAIS